LRTRSREGGRRRRAGRFVDAVVGEPAPTALSLTRRVLQRYKADTDATIKAGFALKDDRAALLAFAEPSNIPG
jgi:hypothetical protein